MAKTKRRLRPRAFIVFLLITVFSLGIYFAAANRTQIYRQAQVQWQHYLDDLPVTAYASESLPGLHSRSVYLMRLHDGQPIYTESPKELVYPASLTKIMTVLVALDQLEDLEQTVRLDEAIFPPLQLANASMAGFEPGEEVRALDLLYAAMLPSGADAAVGLATAIADSEADFVVLMNEKAQQLGLGRTHFMNSTGLHHRNHYSSTGDLAALTLAALSNETFRAIFTAHSYTTAPTNFHPDGLSFASTLFRKLEQTQIGETQILGGKTGFTSAAGLCLATLAEKGGEEYLLITTGAAAQSAWEELHIDDAWRIYASI